MISKENFCSIINALRDYNDELEKITNYLHIDYTENFTTNVVCDIMDALAKDIGDTDDDWLGYFAWELDFGRAEMAEGCVQIKDKEWSLKSAEDLYDFLVVMEVEEKNYD